MYDCTVNALKVEYDKEEDMTSVTDSLYIGGFIFDGEELTEESIVNELKRQSEYGLLFETGTVTAEDITLHDEEGFFEFAIWWEQWGGGAGANIFRVECQKN